MFKIQELVLIFLVFMSLLRLRISYRNVLTSKRRKFSLIRSFCSGKGKGPNSLIAENKRADFDYEWDEKVTAGIKLTGVEAKSCRKGNVLISDGLAEVRNGELWLLNVYIPELKRVGPNRVYDPKRIRKLLVRKNELLKIEQRTLQQNMEIIPIKIYFSDKSFVKVELGIGKQKNLVDKRDDIIKKEGDREIKRVMKSSSRGYD